MAIENNGERIHQEVSFPSLSSKELHGLHAEGWHRVGVVALVIDQSYDVLMLEHKASYKTDEGMLGALGETALALHDGEDWQIEHPLTTLQRGIAEELGVEAAIDQFQAPVDLPFFTLGWPVGVRSMHESAFAVCPVIMVHEDLKAAILTSGPTVEISDKSFVPLEQLTALPGERFRPGMYEWLLEACDALTTAKMSPLAPVSPPAPVEALHAADAILANLYIEK